MRLSLRRRGVFALVSVAAYIVVAGLALDGERQHLRSLSIELEELHGKDVALGRTLHALHHSLLRARELEASDGLHDSSADDIALDLELVHSGLIEVRKYSSAVAPDVERVESLLTRLRQQSSLELVAAVDQLEESLDKRLTAVENELHAARRAIWERYHLSYDRMTLIGVMVNLVGVIVLGALVTMFFSRLTWDINKLKDRAMAIVKGYRGPGLGATRGDEVGDLMAAVDQMQTELREREQKLEIAREQHYHREKMAALGSLASAVAHEINNPIAAIAGVAQAMAAAHKTGRGADTRVVVDGPGMILEQAQRISAISRQIAEFTRPAANKPSMIDVNAVISSTCKFVKYDRRLRNVELELALYKELPAVVAIADHVTQVLMNLLINSADALVDLTERKPSIRISTYRGNGEVVMTVTDNGHGMDSETLERAFDEAFTTKPAGEGRGLGLFLCRALLERDGGRIELHSKVGEGTTSIVRFPLRPASKANEA